MKLQRAPFESFGATKGPLDIQRIYENKQNEDVRKRAWNLAVVVCGRAGSASNSGDIQERLSRGSFQNLFRASRSMPR